MRFVDLSDSATKRVVNASNIARVEQSANGGPSLITFADGSIHYVSLSLEDIMQKIEESKP